jgi:hypothetical protein
MVPPPDPTPPALQQVLDAIKKFDASNETLDGTPLDPLPTTATSHKACYVTYRESMKILIKQWKQKVATLKAKRDSNPEMTASKEMQQVFANVQAELQKCLRTPLHLLKTPKPGDKFP